MHRFYDPNARDSDRIDLAGDEAAHLLRVLRLPLGERVVLFDGKGHAAIAEITEIRKRDATLRIVERLPADLERGPEITLVTAVPKTDRFRWLVEKATELGVRRLIPVQTERSIVHPGDGKRQKMEAASIAACKQCGRNDLLSIETVQSWTSVIQPFPARKLLVADRQGVSLQNLKFAVSDAEEVVLAVGPEGGLTPQEISFSQHNGGQLVSLGGSILRIETAGLALSAWVRFNASTGLSGDSGTSNTRLGD